MPDMILTGDENLPAMPMTEAQVNHLRRLLAWMRCEMGQEPAEMITMTNAIVAKIGPLSDPEGARLRVQADYDHAASYPAYIRQGVRMLTMALRDHERAAGVIDQPADHDR